HGPLGRVASVESTPRETKMIPVAAGWGNTTIPEEMSLFASMFYLLPFLREWPADFNDFTPVAAGIISLHGNCLRLDEGIDVFRSIVDGTSLPNLELPLIVGSVESSALERQVEIKRYIPPELAAHIRDQHPSLHGATEIAVDQAHFEILGAIARAIDAETIRC